MFDFIDDRTQRTTDLIDPDPDLEITPEEVRPVIFSLKMQNVLPGFDNPDTEVFVASCDLLPPYDYLVLLSNDIYVWRNSGI